MLFLIISCAADQSDERVLMELPPPIHSQGSTFPKPLYRLQRSIGTRIWRKVGLSLTKSFPICSRPSILLRRSFHLLPHGSAPQTSRVDAKPGGMAQVTHILHPSIHPSIHTPLLCTAFLIPESCRAREGNIRDNRFFPTQNRRSLGGRL
jgi:hypothetical protein